MTIVNTRNLLVRDSRFLYNKVTGTNLQVDGGAIYLERVVNTIILNCSIVNNSAFCYGCVHSGGIYARGGAIASFETGKLKIINSNFTSNSVGSSVSTYASYGGAVFTEGGTVSSSGSYYSKNQAANGGAIYAEGESISSSDSCYENNFAKGDGGAFFAQGKSIQCLNNHYTNNQGYRGGAIFAEVSDTFTLSSSFINNHADYGGAINIKNSCIISRSSHFINNTARWGGAVSLVGGSGSFSDSHSYYINNSAVKEGGAIRIQSYYSVELGDNRRYIKAEDRHSVTTYGCDFKNNTAGDHGGAIYNNGGSITTLECILTNNKAMEGGAICVMEAILQSDRNQYINNSAEWGGSIWAAGSNISSSHETYTNNTAQNGGGIFAVESTVNFIGNSLTKNWAAEQGAAIHHTGKLIEIRDTVISDNHADDNDILHINTAILICTGEFVFVNNNGRRHNFCLQHWGVWGSHYKHTKSDCFQRQV